MPYFDRIRQLAAARGAPAAPAHLGARGRGVPPGCRSARRARPRRPCAPRARTARRRGRAAPALPRATASPRNRRRSPRRRRAARPSRSRAHADRVTAARAIWRAPAADAAARCRSRPTGADGPAADLRRRVRPRSSRGRRYRRPLAAPPSTPLPPRRGARLAAPASRVVSEAARVAPAHRPGRRRQPAPSRRRSDGAAEPAAVIEAPVAESPGCRASPPSARRGAPLDGGAAAPPRRRDPTPARAVRGRDSPSRRCRSARSR